MNNISFEQAKHIMDISNDFIILDVRDEVEYITGHATGAVNLPVDEITKASAEKCIPSDKTAVFTYCRTGQRSEMACEKLALLGYENIYDIGSLVSWPYGISWD